MAYVSRAWEVRFKLLTSETEFLPVLWWGLGVCVGGVKYYYTCPFIKNYSTL